MGPTARRVLAIALAAQAAGTVGATGWGPWPDLRFVPEPSPGWSFEQLRQAWRPARGFELEEDGVVLVLADRPTRWFRPGDRVAVYYRTMDGGRQGLAGRGEVLSVDRTTLEARVAVRLAHLVQPFVHDPWKGWTRSYAWRPGFAPGEVQYYVSTQNLSNLDDQAFAALLAGDLYRGMPARDLIRTLGSPTARGVFDFAEGRQEQWVYQVDAHRRRYVYVDVATLRVTGWHGSP